MPGRLARVLGQSRYSEGEGLYGGDANNGLSPRPSVFVPTFVRDIIAVVLSAYL